VWPRVLGVFLIAGGCVAGCGSRSPLDDGSAADADDEGAPPPPATGGSGAAPDPSSPGGGNAGTSSTNPSQDALPECVLGPVRAEAEAAGVECNWLVGDRCYERRIAACACACPRDRDSTCVSGSPGFQVGVACL
jgi:hypothetical protein